MHLATLRSNEPSPRIGITERLVDRDVAPRRFDADDGPALVERATAGSVHVLVECSRVELRGPTARRALFDAGRRGAVTVPDASAAVRFRCDLVAATFAASGPTA